MTEQTAPQPLAIRQLFATAGTYPSFYEEQMRPTPVIAMIHPYAAAIDAFDMMPCDGRVLSVQRYSPVYSLIGGDYGGNGYSEFAIPDLRGRVAIGGRPGPGDASGVPVRYLIADRDGGRGFPEVGAIVLMALSRDAAPSGWRLADGSMLAVRDYPDLFEAIGTAFGGDGTNHFALPDLTDRTPIGTGGALGLKLGDTLDGAQAGGTPALALIPAICVNNAVYASQDGPGGVPADEPFLAQIVWMAAPLRDQRRWLPCEGQTLPVQAFNPLYYQLGDRYGGDGRTTFGLPDLRGRTMVGT